MVLKNVENRLERIFERTFSRPFKTSLQPIEIGTRIVREVDLTRRLSSQGPISPNIVRVWLGPADAQRFQVIVAWVVQLDQAGHLPHFPKLAMEVSQKLAPMRIMR